MERLLLDWSLRLTLIVFAAWLLSVLLRRAAPALLHRIFAAALTAALVLPVWTLCGPSIAAPVLPASAAEPAASIEFPLAVVPAPLGAYPAAPRPLPAAPAPARPFPWRALLIGVYLAGAALMLVRLARATLRVRALLRSAQPMGGFAVSPNCAAPVAAGWFRPALLLPESYRAWSPSRFDAILAHEREHLRRHDPLVQWLALLNRALFWFHPLAWWLERKLAILAEESCDAAVLARGISPDAYAECLIDIARSVTLAGVRLRSAGAVTFATGNLPRRIRRIMDPAAPVPSLAKSIGAVAACACLFTALLACRPTQPAAANSSRRLDFAGYQTMAAQDRANMSAQARLRHESSLAIAGNALTPAAAAALATALEANPQDYDKMMELRRYYQFHRDAQALDAQSLWFIEHRPEIRDGWGYRPEWDRIVRVENLPHAVELWRVQLKKTWDTPFAYMNAADFLCGIDDNLAEQAILDGRRLFPSSALHWEIFLAHQYAWALTSPWTPTSEPYIRKVRDAILASNDVDLLDRTLEQLQNRPFNPISQSLANRLLTLRPDSPSAHQRQYQFRLAAARSAEQKSPNSLTDSDRMVLLEGSLAPFGHLHPSQPYPAARATELLDLAARNPQDPTCGIAVMIANLVLGQALLDEGDVPGATSHLLAAAAPPRSGAVRYLPVDMTLARRLVDAGQRDAVAQFLDRCAQFSASRQPFKTWATAIRQGQNPVLHPYFDGFQLRG